MSHAVYGPETHHQATLYGGITYHLITSLTPYTPSFTDGHANTVQGELVTSWQTFGDVPVLINPHTEIREVPFTN